MTKESKVKKVIMQKTQSERSFGQNLKNFLQHLEGLRKAVELSMFATILFHNKETKDLNDFIDKYGKEVTVKGKKTKKLNLEFRNQLEYENLLKEQEATVAAIKFIPRSLLVSSVSQFDVFISGLMKRILILNPERMSKDKFILYEKLYSFSSIDEIREYVLDEEVEDVLRGDHSGCLDWFEKKVHHLKIKAAIEDQRDVFIELTERRNIFVHMDGIVNDQYLNSCRKNNIKIPPDIIKGKTLEVTPQYFFDTSNCMYEIGIRLTWLIWRNLEADDIEEIDTIFNDIGIGLLKQKKFTLAENVYKFMINHCADSKDLTKNMFLVNYALSKKLNNNPEEAKKLLTDKDWSIYIPELQMAVHLIKDELDEAFVLMKKIGANSDFLIKENYETDPIYTELRKDPRFKKIFKTIFKVEYVSNNIS